MCVGRGGGDGGDGERVGLEGMAAGESGYGEEDVLSWRPAGFVAVGK